MGREELTEHTLILFSLTHQKRAERKLESKRNSSIPHHHRDSIHRAGAGRRMSVSQQSNEDGLHSSWEHLHYLHESGDSLEHAPSSSFSHNEDMEQILLDAQLEPERNSSRGGSQCESPPLTMSPQSSPKLLETEPGNSVSRTSLLQSKDAVPAKALEMGSLLKESPDWIWDWASRPEHIPPKEFFFKRHQQQQMPSQAQVQPQNQTRAILSIQQTSILKKGGNNVFSSEMLMVFIPSLILSHLLTLGLGIYIGKRLAASPTNL